MLYTVKTISNKAQNEQKNPLHMVFFVIKKKVFKKAVDRNRVKRRARKAFLDAIKTIDGTHIEYSDQTTSILNVFRSNNKKIIFFLEHDMIQELYSGIVSKMVEDIKRLAYTCK